MDAVIAGFAVSLSLIVAIGAQNAFVLKQGLRKHQNKNVAFGACVGFALHGLVRTAKCRAGASLLPAAGRALKSQL